MSMGGDSQAEKVSASSRKAAAQASGEVKKLADKTVKFTDKFYAKEIKPEIDRLQAATRVAQGRSDDLYTAYKEIADNREQLFGDVGEPAIRSYFEELNNLDRETEMERQAALALGDVKAQQAVAEKSEQRRSAALGINPMSGSAQSGRAMMANRAAMTAAAESQRARRLAGLEVDQKKFSGAQFANQLGQGAVGTMQGMTPIIGQGVAIPAATVGTVADAGRIPLAGYGQATSAWSSMYGTAQSSATSSTQAADQSGGGFGSLVGTVLGGGLGWMAGGPAGALKGASVGSGLFS